MTMILNDDDDSLVNVSSCDYTHIQNDPYSTAGSGIHIGDNTNDPGLSIGDDTSGYTLTNNPYYTYPANGGIIWQGSSGSTITISSNKDKYSILDLPREDCPTSVFVCGRMVTLGIIGTDVECAYIGDKLIFEPGIIHSISYEGRVTISVEYKDEIYHYNVGNGSIIHYVDNSPTLDATLVSTIQK